MEGTQNETNEEALSAVKTRNELIDVPRSRQKRRIRHVQLSYDCLVRTVLCLVSSIPLPFCCCHFVVAVARENGMETSFRMHRDEVTRTRLVVNQRQNGKNRIRSYLLRNGSYGTTAGGNGNGATDFFT